MDALRENRSALDARGVDHCAALPVVSLDACERARSPGSSRDRGPGRDSGAFKLKATNPGSCGKGAPLAPSSDASQIEEVKIKAGGAREGVGAMPGASGARSGLEDIRGGGAARTSTGATRPRPSGVREAAMA